MTTTIIGSGQSSGGITVTSGNTVEVLGGGTATGTIVSSGGVIDVDSGAVVSGTTLIGGSEFVYYDAAVTGTTIAAGGAEYLAESTASGSLIDSGGIQYVEDGLAVNTTVTSGGFESVSQGGLASGTIFNSGGYAVITSGGEIRGATVSGGVIIAEPHSLVASSTILTGGSVVSTGVAVVEPGSAPALYAAVANGVTVGTGAEALVLNGGSATQTTLDGAMFVFGGGRATDTTVAARGLEFAYSGSVIKDTTLAGLDAELTVSQTLATSTIVDSGGFLELLQGKAASTTINSGGHEYVFSGSRDSGATVGVGGTESVMNGGTALNDTVAGTLSFGYDAIVSTVTIVPSGTVAIGLSGTLEGSIVFSGGSGTLEVLSTTVPSGVISGFGTEDRIHLDHAYVSGATGSIVSGATDQLVVADNGLTYTFQIAGNYAGATVELAADDGGTDVTLTGTGGVLNGIPCFVAGTLITTARGPVAVERLAVGDSVVTVDDEPVPIVWIGQRHVDCRRHPRPTSILPVCVEAHAFGPGRPERDLFLSPDHALYAEGVLIPVKYLINGQSVRQVDRGMVTYLHIELPRHAVLLAENLPAESYLDTGDRFAFGHDTDVTALHPSFGMERADVTLMQEAAGCAPLHVTGPVVERVRAMLIGLRPSRLAAG